MDLTRTTVVVAGSTTVRLSVIDVAPTACYSTRNWKSSGTPVIRRNSNAQKWSTAHQTLHQRASNLARRLEGKDVF
ncbi:MAG: hypothetical protein J7463_14360 [Roseiflexus sp.]|jgi:hypothetical protein|nr:hypothetical protein [Roseiflexus sp.]MBO9335694.1 hypothetical protein [Roseiflexus sp.]MBO9342055.1 hypothetical protein [Roseiflexus sp.]MBO9365033.1 hypothetical protein [Roseiflexus sp.]MBO9383712.1 hypothetical protein [Roseiflexus sp.]